MGLSSKSLTEVYSSIWDVPWWKLVNEIRGSGGSQIKGLVSPDVWRQAYKDLVYESPVSEINMQLRENIEDESAR